MGNDAQKFTIKTSIDPTEAQSGAGQTTDALKGIAKAADDTTESTNLAAKAGSKLAENLESLKTSHHALEAVGDIARGGTEAIAGEAMAVRILGETLEGLIPGFGPVLIAISTVVAIGAQMVARMQEHNEKMADGKDKADALKSSVEGMNTALEAYKTAAAQSLDDLTEAEKRTEEGLDLTAKTGQTRLDLLTKELDLREKLIETILAAGRAQELADNKGGAEGAQSINQKYDALKEGYDERFQFQKLDLEKQQIIAQEQERGHKAAAEMQARAAMQKQLDDLKAKTLVDQQNASAAGVPLNKTDKEYMDFAAQRMEALKKAGDDQTDLQKQIDYYSTKDPHLYEDRVADLQKDLTDKTAELASLTKQISAALALTRSQNLLTSKADGGGKKLAADIAASDQKLAELDAQGGDFQQKIENIDLAKQLAAAKANADKATLSLKDKRANEELSDRDYEGQIEAQKKGFEDVVKDKSKPAADREAAARKVGELEAEALQRKLDESMKPGAEKPLTPGEIAAQKAGIDSARASGVDRANQIADEVGKQQAATTKKGDAADHKDLVDDIKAKTEWLKQSGDKDLVKHVTAMAASVGSLQEKSALLDQAIIEEVLKQKGTLDKAMQLIADLQAKLDHRNATQ